MLYGIAVCYVVFMRDLLRAIRQLLPLLKIKLSRVLTRLIEKWESTIQ